MIEYKDVDYLEHADSAVLLVGETHLVKAKYVREEGNDVVLYNKNLLTRKEVEVLRLFKDAIDYYKQTN